VSDTYGNEGKTERPTARRLQKAREDGFVLRAHSVAAGALLLAGAAALTLAGAKLVELLELSLRRGLSFEPDRAEEPARLLATAARIVIPGLEIVVPFLILMAIVGLVADVVVGGWVFSGQPLSLNFSRINPVLGFQRLLSRAALVELIKALVKFAVVGAIAFWLIYRGFPDFLQIESETWPGSPYHAALLWTRIFLILATSLVGLALLEVPYQIWAHRDRLKMSRQDVKDELRELDGSPYTRRRIKLLRCRLARMRMAMEVPKADVVITNPEHYAAALQYQEGKMRAPRLIAKGTGLIALRIRDIAAEHRVPLIEAPPLARAICRFVELEDEIPAGLYAEVAEVLAHVYRVRIATDTGRPAPLLPPDQRFEPPPEFAA
jgi:flagellar biosynthesis protein FlhB